MTWQLEQDEMWEETRDAAYTLLADLAGFVRLLRNDFDSVYSPVAALNLNQCADSLLANTETLLLQMTESPKEHECTYFEGGDRCTRCGTLKQHPLTNRGEK